MYTVEQYRMYQIVDHLVHKGGYRVLDVHEEEVWLEKYEQKVSKVIRIIHKGFDWKNHLKLDITRVFHTIAAFGKLLPGKTIEIHNIYTTSLTPVDDWEYLTNPLQPKGKFSLTMQVYYMSDSRVHDELAKLNTALGVHLEETNQYLSETEREIAINHYKQSLLQTVEKKEKEDNDIFSFGKPFVTCFFLIINVMMFLLLEINGGSTDVENLINFGAKYNPAIVDGEWWRIISSMFLHVGFLHLAMNMFALYYLGKAVERIFGSIRLVFIYLLAGVGGGLMSFAFTGNVSAGASGAIFGLFGALLYFGVIYKQLFFQMMGKNILMVIAINILFGFVIPQIDVSAHIGGLVAGFLVTAVVYVPKSKNVAYRLSALLMYILLVIGLIIFGLKNSMNHITYQLVKIEEHFEDEDYDAVIAKVTETLDKPDIFEAELLFQRSVAYIKQNEPYLAIIDLEKSISIKDDFSEAYYNLAILYFTNDQNERAAENIKKAYELNPGNSDYKDLYDKIIQNKVQR